MGVLVCSCAQILSRLCRNIFWIVQVGWLVVIILVVGDSKRFRAFLSEKSTGAIGVQVMRNTYRMS